MKVKIQQYDPAQGKGKNDCFARSLSYIFQIPYQSAQSFSRKYTGQKINDGPTWKGFKKFMYKSAHACFFREIPIGKNGEKYMDFIRKHPEGIYLVLTKDHSFVVHDGVLIDNFGPSVKKEIEEGFIYTAEGKGIKTILNHKLFKAYEWIGR